MYMIIHKYTLEYTEIYQYYHFDSTRYYFFKKHSGATIKILEKNYYYFTISEIVLEFNKTHQDILFCVVFILFRVNLHLNYYYFLIFVGECSDCKKYQILREE